MDRYFTKVSSCCFSAWFCRKWCNTSTVGQNCYKSIRQENYENCNALRTMQHVNCERSITSLSYRLWHILFFFSCPLPRLRCGDGNLPWFLPRVFRRRHFTSRGDSVWLCLWHFHRRLLGKTFIFKLICTHKQKNGRQTICWCLSLAMDCVTSFAAFDTVKCTFVRLRLQHFEASCLLSAAYKFVYKLSYVSEIQTCPHNICCTGLSSWNTEMALNVKI